MRHFFAVFRSIFEKMNEIWQKFVLYRRRMYGEIDYFYYLCIRKLKTIEI